MTRIWPLLLGAAALLSPEVVRAAVVYDSIDINPAAFNSGLETGNTSWDWVDPSANGPNASQFTVAYTQTLTSISLELSADTPDDGGLIVVVLMSDQNGSLPYTTIPDPLTESGSLATLTGTTVLATIQDSSLSQTSSLVTINPGLVLAAGTYWIGTETALLPGSADDPVNGTYGSGQWWWTNPDSSVPVTNNFHSVGSIGPFPVGGSANPGAYELIVDTPEPATIALLGGGLASLGYFKRCKATKV
jgi:hypothetical protein